MRKVKNGKAAGKDEVTGKVKKGERGRVVDWIWRLYNMFFERGVVPEDWRSAVIVPLYKGIGKRKECGNYRGVSLLSMVGKIYTEILIDRVRIMTESLIDDEQGSFRAGRGCVDQIFTLNQIDEKALEKKCRF